MPLRLYNPLRYEFEEDILILIVLFYLFKFIVGHKIFVNDTGVCTESDYMETTYPG